MFLDELELKLGPINSEFTRIAEFIQEGMSVMLFGKDKRLVVTHSKGEPTPGQPGADAVEQASSIPITAEIIPDAWRTRNGH